MLTELLGELHNWFDRARYPGTFTVENGRIALPFLREGQYYRILGSIFSDGVHRYGHEAEDELTDEVFTGSVWALAVPKEVVDLASQIRSWQESYGETTLSPVTGESLTVNGYSYTAATSGAAREKMTWRDAFAGPMRRWKKV